MEIKHAQLFALVKVALKALAEDNPHHTVNEWARSKNSVTTATFTWKPLALARWLMP
jgi:hypothetical protein